MGSVFPIREFLAVKASQQPLALRTLRQGQGLQEPSNLCRTMDNGLHFHAFRPGAVSPLCGAGKRRHLLAFDTRPSARRRQPARSWRQFLHRRPARCAIPRPGALHTHHSFIGVLPRAPRAWPSGNVGLSGPGNVVGHALCRCAHGLRPDITEFKERKTLSRVAIQFYKEREIRDHKTFQKIFPSADLVIAAC